MLDLFHTVRTMASITGEADRSQCTSELQQRDPYAVTE
jgi:hypothetical protein